MSEAWIYARDEPLATQTARQLAESGFHPRYVRGVGLRPDDRGGGDCDRRAPTLAIVVAAPGERAPSKLCAQLLNKEEMEHVPLLVTLEPGQFDDGPAVRDAHEVLVRPFSTTELVARIGRARERLAGEGSETIRFGSMSFRGRHCSERCGTTPTTEERARSTSMSGACGPSSGQSTHVGSGRCAAWATGGQRTGPDSRCR